MSGLIELDAEARENSNRPGGDMIRLFDFRGILGHLSAWNLCAMTFIWWLDRLILGLVRCRTNRC
jgi:hypothetical protein